MKVNTAYLPQLQTQTGNGQYVADHGKTKDPSKSPPDKNLFQQILKECLTK